MNKYCLIKDFEEQFKYYTASAIRHKIQDGTWLNGREYVKSPDGHIFIDLEQVEKYIESQKPIIPIELKY